MLSLQKLPLGIRRLLTGGMAALIALLIVFGAPHQASADDGSGDKTNPVYFPGNSFLLWNSVQRIEDPSQAFQWIAKAPLTLEGVQFVQGRIQKTEKLNGRYGVNQSFYVNIYNVPPPPTPAIEPAGLFFAGLNEHGIMLIINDARFRFGQDLKITAFYRTGFIRYSGIPKN